MKVAKFTVSGMIGTPNAQLQKELASMGVYSFTQPKQLRAFLEENADAEEIEITFDSIGGDVVQGFEIYDLLKQVGRTKKLTTIAQRADSIASVGFLAGSVRKAVKGCSFLIHSAWLSPTDLDPDVRLNELTLDEIKKVNQTADSQILAVYAEVAGRQIAGQLSDLMKKETKLSAEVLLRLNFATEIIEGTPDTQARRAIAYNSLAFNIETPKQYADVIGMQNGKVLLIQRSATSDFEPNKWAFAGGKIEEGETPAEAAARELQEETGYTAKRIEPMGAQTHEDGSVSHYFSAELEGSPTLDPEEIQSAKFVSLEEIEGLEIICDEKELYLNLIQQAMDNSLLDRIAKGMDAMSARLKAMGASKAMTLELADGQKLYIFSEDGELAGKSAVIATPEGEPTEQPAPAGTHPIADGRSIVVGEGGVIESVEEAAAPAPSEDMAALTAERDALTARIAAMDEEQKKKEAEMVALQTANAEMAASLQALNTEFEGLKAIVAEVAGDGKTRGISPKAQGGTAPDWDKMTPSQRAHYNYVNSKN
jgi:8-oxo-dGTP diphosphatase